MRLKLVTANRLDDGAVVYLDRSGAWSTDIDDAATTGADAIDGPLAAAARSVIDCRVVEPYALDIDLDGGKIVPVTFRERIRALGPTAGPVVPATAKSFRGSGADVPI